MKTSITLLVFLGLLSCNQADETFPKNILIGTWQLQSYCKPSSTTNCLNVLVPTDKKVFISFSKNNTFNEWYQNTFPSDYSFFGCGGGTYTIDGNNVRIQAACMSSMNGRLVEIVSANTQRLVLNPYGTGEYIFKKQ
jgi:hypothetical protein